MLSILSKLIAMKQHWIQTSYLTAGLRLIDLLEVIFRESIAGRNEDFPEIWLELLPRAEISISGNDIYKIK
jgi:hypothetical protein